MHRKAALRVDMTKRIVKPGRGLEDHPRMATRGDHERHQRSRLAQYGDEEFALFLRRGFLKGAGYTDESLDLPIVGILSTASDFNPCHGTAARLAEAVARGVRMAGALPFIFPTISLHEAFTYPTSMLLRNLMSMDVEEMLKALPLDSVVMIGGCDKTIPAELMGAISADVPAIVLPVGSMLAGRHEGTRLGACTDCRRLWAQHRAGTLDEVNLNRAHDQLMPTSGTCMVMGTASTMACIAETLGFTLPGAATAPAVSSDRMRIAEASGKRAAEMAVSGAPTPQQLLTKTALRNAAVILQTTSGSTNALVHVAAIAGRAGLSFDLDEFDKVGRDVPVLVNLKPAGQFFIEDFHAGGGVPALWRRLRDKLDLSAKTVTGETLGDIVSAGRPTPTTKSSVHSTNRSIRTRLSRSSPAISRRRVRQSNSPRQHQSCSRIRAQHWCSIHLRISRRASTIRICR